MSKRFALTALATATLCGAAPAFAQASGADPDRHLPQVAPVPSVTPAAPAQPAPAPGANDRREPRGQRDANRQPRQPQDPAHAPPRNDGRRGDNNDNRHADRRHGNEHHGSSHRDYRSSGYVVARPSYIYAPPTVYYSGPTVYYGGVPQGYYPSNGYGGSYGYNNGYNNGYGGYAGNGAPAMLRPGDYLPPEFRQQQYVVLDWEWRGLAAPPDGYHWMLLGPDNYALVLASTGQIASVVAAR